MLAGGGDGEAVLPLGRREAAGDAVHPVVSDLPHPVGAVLPLAAAQGLEGRRQGVEEGVVPVEDDGAAGAEVLQDLRLGLQNSLPAAEKLNVGVADVGDDGDVGLHHLP